MKFSEQDVLQAIQQDKEAFEKIYRDINMDLYKMALYILGNPEAAKEVVSETVLDAFMGIGKLKDAAKFESWILKILTNKCKRHIKDKYNKFGVFHPNVRELDYSSLTYKSEIDYDTKADIKAAIQKLDRQDRIIISLCVVQGYTSIETAKILSMNPSTVRSRLNRSLKKLRKYLEVE